MNEDNKNKNQMCQNEVKPIVPIPAKVLAEVAGCSESAVKKVLTGKRNPESKTGKKVSIAKDLLETCINVSITQVKAQLKKIALIIILSLMASCKKECIEPVKERVTPAPDRVIERPVLQPSN